MTVSCVRQTDPWGVVTGITVRAVSVPETLSLLTLPTLANLSISTLVMVRTPSDTLPTDLLILVTVLILWTVAVVATASLWVAVSVQTIESICAVMTTALKLKNQRMLKFYRFFFLRKHNVYVRFLGLGAWTHRVISHMIYGGHVSYQ